MRATPGLLGGAGLVAGLMYLLGRRREKRRRNAGKMRLVTTIAAPIKRVFDARSRFEDFPRFMPMVAGVRPAGNDRWQWTIADPGGASVQCVTRITQRDRPHLIAWATDGDAVAEHRGTVRFRPTAGRRTRMEIDISPRASGDCASEGMAPTAAIDPERALREGVAAFKARVEEAAYQGV